MKVLMTSHSCGDRNTIVQKMFVTTHDSVERLFCDENELQFPLTLDKWTAVNAYGVFITDPAECMESWVRIDQPETIMPLAEPLPDHTRPWNIPTEYIIAARHRAKWSQEKLAKAAGVSIMTVQRLEHESGVRRPATMTKVVEALRTAGISI